MWYERKCWGREDYNWNFTSSFQMPENNKPSNGLFKQQRLPAWQPILSPPHVAVCFLIIGVIFLPIGIAVLFANKNGFDEEVEYTDYSCTASQNAGVFQYTVDNHTQRMGCRRTVSLNVTADLEGPVYMYYKLSNFYQNHRRYAKSRSDGQLAGDEKTASSISDTSPLSKPGEFSSSTGTALTVGGEPLTYDQMVYNPAGLIAWSMFNDSFEVFSVDANNIRTLICSTSQFDKGTNEPLINQSCVKKGIAWDSDVSAKYQKPNNGNKQWTGLRSLYGETPLVTTDPFLSNGWYANESGHAVPVATDEDFMVWMRTASLPDFRKLFRVFKNGLKKGNYEIDVIDQYDVSGFNGKKAIVFATVSWAGGKNPFLAVAYIVVGAVVIVAAAVFFVIHKIYGDRSQKAIEQLMKEMK